MRDQLCPPVTFLGSFLNNKLSKTNTMDKQFLCNNWGSVTPHQTTLQTHFQKDGIRDFFHLSNWGSVKPQKPLET